MKENLRGLLISLLLILLLAGCTQAPEASERTPDRFDLQPLTFQNVRAYTFTAAPSTLSYMNETFEGFYAYNRQIPGPVIHALRGETLRIKLVNMLPENTTIHWHGLQVPNSMDGVPWVTQDPVPPRGTFTYTFPLNESGIYWYHSHVKTDEQIERGLQGVIIIDDPNLSLPVARDRVIVLDDVRLQEGRLAPFTLLRDGHMAGRYGNAYLINGKPEEVFTAPAGSLVRLRLVNTANARVFQLRASSPFIKLGDGISFAVTPRFMQDLILSPGERADILVYLNRTPFTLTHTNTRRPAVLVTILPKGENETLSRQAEAYWMEILRGAENDLANLPDWSFMQDWEPNITLTLRGGRDARSPYGFSWRINERAWPYDPDIQNLTEGALYKIRYVNTQRIWHPMHVHGQKFIVLSMNGEPQEADAWRDMILVPPGGSVDIALKAEGIGNWLEHCHILEHAELGMMGLFNVTANASERTT